VFAAGRKLTLFGKDSGTDKGEEEEEEEERRDWGV